MSGSFLILSELRPEDLDELAVSNGIDEFIVKLIGRVVDGLYF